MSVNYCAPVTVKFLAQVEYQQLGFDADVDYEAFIEETLIPASMKFVDGYCNHNFQHNSGTLTLDGSGKETLLLGRGAIGDGLPANVLPLPMIAVSSVTIDGAAQNIADFQIYDTYITYENNVFAQGRQNVVLVAEWGYSAVPDDVRVVTALLCANFLREMIRSRLLPDLVTPILTAERGAVGVLFAHPKILTENEKPILDQYRFYTVSVA